MGKNIMCEHEMRETLELLMAGVDKGIVKVVSRRLSTGVFKDTYDFTFRLERLKELR